MDINLETRVCMLESHMDGMISRAKRNEEMLKRFQDLEMRLLSVNSLRELIEHVHDDAKIVFDLSSLSLVLSDPSGEYQQFLSEDGFKFDEYSSVILINDKNLLAEKLGFSQRIILGEGKSILPKEFWGEGLPLPLTVAIVPLQRRGVYLGCLVFGSDEATRFQADMATYFLECLGKVLSVCMENSLNYEQLRRSSLFDTLTGVNNRHFFEQRMDEEISRSIRTGDQLSCLFIDIDFFKKVNDEYGHQAGDVALKLVANCLRQQLRGNDVLARYGGEEFVAILPTASESKGLEVAERMRQSVERLAIDVAKGISLQVTISVGVSTFVVQEIGQSKPIDKAVLIERADKALYEAKNTGRNKVVGGGVEGAASKHQLVG